jgi:MFS-type transporter involved in bile tolerance (Atg22 family)
MRQNRRSAAFQFRLAGILTVTAVLAFLFAALGGILRKGGAAENQYVIYFIMMMMAPLMILLIFGAVDRWRGRDLESDSEDADDS